MRQTVEEMLGYFNQIRRVYANELNLKFTNENFSPNEISILILLSNNPSINTSSQLCTILGVQMCIRDRVYIDFLSALDSLDRMTAEISDILYFQCSP